MNQAQLSEVDQIDPTGHLGDYTELADPYPSTRAAWRGATQVLPGEVHADPDEVRQDMAGYAAAPHKQGTQVRQVVASQWFANSYLFPDGANGMRILDFDPQRTYVEITNHSAAGDVYLAVGPQRLAGAGTLYVPMRQAGVGGRVFTKTFRSTAEVYVFTLADFIQGASPVTLQIYGERLT